MKLTPNQQSAVDHVRSFAAARRPEAVRRIRAALDDFGGAVDVGSLASAIATRTRVALNFHPDRLANDGLLVAESLADFGLYRNQFESGISAGLVAPYAGSERDQWEERFFSASYQAAGVVPRDRPKYGALNVLNYIDGPCPRFGSCHLRLKPEVLRRCTFCFGDSHMGPADLGTIDEFASVLAALFDEVVATGAALGRQMGVRDVVETIQAPQKPVMGHILDGYIEAQVHGTVELARDAEAVVADPSFRQTRVGELLSDASAKYGLHLEWHDGYELGPDDFDPEFRGPQTASLAVYVAHELGAARLDAEVVGRVARSVVTDPAKWEQWGDPASVLQLVKYVWHTLVRFGTAHRGGSSDRPSG